ncbi:hypothetical protein CF651_25290 [Paenibacillus rigui]|uniref:Uncharacterized protein n=1 Tax=Paenibacillus rigui TaxID=554312 RepID=A0A229UJE9_9BACL|nr:hypothetical protein CF651_25290 [Paenibacillus rigui]
MCDVISEHVDRKPDPQHQVTVHRLERMGTRYRAAGKAFLPHEAGTARFTANQGGTAKMFLFVPQVQQLATSALD